MYSVLSNAQAKQYLDAVAVFEDWRETSRQVLEYRGGMHWKTVAGRSYLYRTKDRLGNAKSLGPRSDATEQLYEQFTARKEALTSRLADLKETMRTHARVNAALRLGSVPNEVADVCSELDAAQLMGKSMMVIGTNAMHAYAYLAGVRFQADIMATTDVDLLWNHKAKLSLMATAEVSKDGLLGLLQRCDKTYVQDPRQRFRARSSTGFMVDLIRQMPEPPWADEPDRLAKNDLVATDISNMDWLLSAPRIEQPAVAVDGRVFMMTAPDPRAFAAFKVWLSQEPGRDPLKKGRDIAQARAVLRVLEERLPHLPLIEAMQSFPKQVVDAVKDELSSSIEPASTEAAAARRRRP
ncbi:nucleotidyltransferase family protein [Methylibium petroleiphilum]|uniref:Nucleotidyltransferase-like domain-containing protein n=1 Tax=Methylibium petroleiphilum (strain ATCC BAA-1232 / LMG 22953 / PM1) TaxID=420662 RepID=A2SPA0_METPP|nr:nucleotidyltransferase domain-containing protein [Methylibium petroleiphilum]ABM97389.1 conserved hypothetical protein [Methylibium petroleiphilum PM1]